ncbi:MAG: hypothetical protein M3178_09230 [Pseudomonadota bacterium]|nr:hypothetical protein [Pseudomonadota bacterium]
MRRKHFSSTFRATAHRAATMAALDRELTRGGDFVARAEDLNRLVSPLFSLAPFLVRAQA